VGEAGVCVESLLSEQRRPRTQRPAKNSVISDFSAVNFFLCLCAFVAQKSVKKALKTGAFLLKKEVFLLKNSAFLRKNTRFFLTLLA